MTNDEKLHLLVQRVADLQARQEALEYVVGIIFPITLKLLPKETALEILSAARSAKVVTSMRDQVDDLSDTQVIKLKIEEAIQGLIDETERRVRRGNLSW
ncbi:MAG: hypothetical protein J0G36_22115 [Afipia sp.]|nr:hypothetical protein [Afipia sp.]